jgi:DNA-binding MarR family transcriptional regulator
MATNGNVPGKRLNVGVLRTFRSKLRILEREIGRCLEEQTDCCGVTVAQCHVVLELDGLGSVNLQALADRLELDKSTLSRAVDSLVELRLVARKEDPENRRQQIISLTKSGEGRVADIHRRCDRYYQEMLARVPTADLSAIVRGIGLLAEAMLTQRRDAGTLQCCRKTLARLHRKAKRDVNSGGKAD